MVAAWRRRGRTKMIQLLTQLLKVPVAAFVASMEIFVKAMREIERVFGQSIDSMAGGATQTVAEPTSSIGESGGDERNARNDGVIEDNAQPNFQTTVKEVTRMPDQDLGGDDLKLVRYKVLFTKRDYEVAFDEQEDLVSYSTTPAAFGGLRLRDFLAAASAGKLRRPSKWIEKNYPDDITQIGTRPDGSAIEEWSISVQDQKYIQLYLEVIGRYPKEEKEYDKELVEVLRDKATSEKEQVKVLKEIRNKIGGE
jgi:hypothetical protein